MDDEPRTGGGRWSLSTGLVAVKLRPCSAAEELHRRRLQGDRRPWLFHMAPGLPTAQVVNIESRWNEFDLILKVPDHVLAKTSTWGHTEWSSSLVRADITAKKSCGILYVNDKVKLTISAFVSLVIVAPLTSCAYAILFILAHDWPKGVLPASTVVYAFSMMAPLVMAIYRRFGVWFALWRVLIIIDLIVKGPAIAMQLYSVFTKTSDQQESVWIWLQLGTLLMAALSGGVSLCLFWVATRLKRAIAQEDSMSQVLISVERPRKVLSSKPLSLWAVGALPGRYDDVSRGYT